MYTYLLGYRWPPVPTLLGSDLSMMYIQEKPREAWTADEWRRYAEFLEHSGNLLNEELRRTHIRLNDKIKKASRSKRKPTRKGTLLTGYEQARRGRKPDSNTNNIAIKVLAYQGQDGKRVTDKLAIIHVLTTYFGHAEYRARQKVETISREMSAIRKQRGTPKRRQTQ